MLDQTMHPNKLSWWNNFNPQFSAGDSTPAPNAYGLPPVLGSKVINKTSAASYSMTARSKTGGFSEDLAKTPGPGHYKVTPPDTVKQNAPKYSMLSRNHMPGGGWKKLNAFLQPSSRILSFTNLVHSLQYVYTILMFLIRFFKIIIDLPWPKKVGNSMLLVSLQVYIYNGQAEKFE